MLVLGVVLGVAWLVPGMVLAGYGSGRVLNMVSPVQA